jgi:hypothetical protein
MSKKQILLNNIFWGFILWVFGYILGIFFFAFVPKDLIGFFILPLGVAFTLWVLLKKISRAQLMCYAGLGIIWTLMAIVLDYLFIVILFNSGNAYYKPDVLLYYFLTFTLPIIVGYWKYKHKSPQAELF